MKTEVKKIMFNSSNCSVPISMDVVPAGSNGNSGYGGFGDGWIVWLFFILCIFWGGFGNGNGFGGGGANGSGFQGYATRSDINEGFALNNLQSGINAIQQGICDATYAISNQINGVNTNIMQSTNAIQQGINANTVANMQGFNSLQALIAQCCCDTKVGQMQIQNQMASDTCTLQNTMNNNTRDQIESTNSGIRAIMDKLSQMEYNSLNDKYQAALADNQTLRFKASQSEQNAFITANQSAQTAELIRRLGMDCPVNAVVVQPNTPVAFPTNCCGQFNGWGNGYNNSCGGCGSCA